MSTIAPSPPVQSPTVSPMQSPTISPLSNQPEVTDTIKVKKISLIEELFKLTGKSFTVDEALNSPDIPINFFKEKLKAAEKFEEEAAAHKQLREEYELFKEKHFMEKGWYKRIEKDYVKCKNEFDDLVDRFYACKYDSDCE